MCTYMYEYMYVYMHLHQWVTCSSRTLQTGVHSTMRAGVHCTQMFLVDGANF